MRTNTNNDRSAFVSDYLMVAGSLLEKRVMETLAYPSHEYGWIAASPFRPFFHHLALRYKNMIASILLDPIDSNGSSLLNPLDKKNQLNEAKSNNLIPCLFPFCIKTGKPIHDGWHLVNTETGEPVELDKLANNEDVPMSKWELMNFAIDIVIEKLKKDGMTIHSYCDIPGIKPQIWFSFKDKGMMSMTVRAAMANDESRIEVPLSCFQGKMGSYPSYFINVEFNDIFSPEKPYISRGKPFNYEMSEVLTLASVVNAKKYASLSIDSVITIKDHMPENQR